MDKNVFFLSRMVESLNVGDINLLKEFLEEDVTIIMISGGSDNISNSPLYRSESKKEIERIIDKSNIYLNRLAIDYGTVKERQIINCISKIKNLISQLEKEYENNCSITLCLVYIYKIICTHLMMRNMIDLKFKNVDKFNSDLIEKFFSDKKEFKFNIDALNVDNILVKMVEFFNLVNSDFIAKNEKELLSNYMSNLNDTIIKNISL